MRPIFVYSHMAVMNIPGFISEKSWSWVYRHLVVINMWIVYAQSYRVVVSLNFSLFADIMFMKQFKIDIIDIIHYVYNILKTSFQYFKYRSKFFFRTFINISTHFVLVLNKSSHTEIVKINS